MTKPLRPKKEKQDFRGIEILLLGLVYPLILFQVVRLAVWVRDWIHGEKVWDAQSLWALFLIWFAGTLALLLSYPLFWYVKSKPHSTLVWDTSRGVGTRGLLRESLLYGIALLLIIVPTELLPRMERVLGSHPAGLLTLGCVMFGILLALHRSRNPGVRIGPVGSRKRENDQGEEKEITLKPIDKDQALVWFMRSQRYTFKKAVKLKPVGLRVSEIGEVLQEEGTGKILLFLGKRPMDLIELSQAQWKALGKERTVKTVPNLLREILRHALPAVLLNPVSAFMGSVLLGIFGIQYLVPNSSCQLALQDFHFDAKVVFISVFAPSLTLVYFLWMSRRRRLYLDLWADAVTLYAIYAAVAWIVLHSVGMLRLVQETGQVINCL